MPRANAIVRKAAVKRERVVDTVALDHLARQSPGAHLTAAGGLSVTVDLPGDAQLNDGDALKLEDGGLVAIAAADEKLLEVRAENPLRLMRILWHLGQAHAAVEVTADAIYVAQDDAIAELARGQGCSLTPVERPFRPERTIAGHDCGHDHHGHHEHGHDHGHHDHGHHDHGHKHHDHHGHDHHGHAHAAHEHDEQADQPAHKHDDACGCGHDHHAAGHHGHDHKNHDHKDHDHAGHDHAHDDHAEHGHKHHSHAHHGHDHGKDGH